MPIDSSNMLKVIDEFPIQCKTSLGLAKGMAVSGKINRIIVAGMGGSAVGGDLLKYWSKCLIEIEIKKGRRNMNLIKHRSLPEKEMPFIIVNEGIKKRGYFGI